MRTMLKLHCPHECERRIMPTIARFDPPANLNDFDAIPGHREEWSKYISDTFDRSISERIEKDSNGKPRDIKSQYYNETKVSSDEPVDLEIVWDAFPKTLTRQYGREAALKIADEFTFYNVADVDDDKFPFYQLFKQSRRQDEYCEWRVTRDPKTDKILSVIFTCEGPEYWQSMFGGNITGDGNDGFEFKGDKQVLLGLYRAILNDQDVKLEDLVFSDGPKVGQYNPWNRWNTTKGIVHLQQLANTLAAQINIGADATIRRKKGGREITDAQPLICCGGFGGVERSSDPTIGDEVNKLARAGFAITLRNPVGIYFHSFENAGFTKPGPGGSRVPAGNYLTALRGTFKEPFNDSSNMIVRAIYEVPTGEVGPDGQQLTVSDIQIAGEEIAFGGQIAERIKMKFVGRGTRKGQIENSAFECDTKCCSKGDLLRAVPLKPKDGKPDPCEDFFP